MVSDSGFFPRIPYENKLLAELLAELLAKLQAKLLAKLLAELLANLLPVSSIFKTVEQPYSND